MNPRAILFLLGVILFFAGIILTVYNKELVDKWINWRKGLYGESNIRAYNVKMLGLQTASGTIGMAGMGLLSIVSALEKTHFFYYVVALIFGSGIAGIVTGWFIVKRK